MSNLQNEIYIEDWLENTKFTQYLQDHFLEGDGRGIYKDNFEKSFDIWLEELSEVQLLGLIDDFKQAN